jgi:hypothetical protein
MSSNSQTTQDTQSNQGSSFMTLHFVDSIEIAFSEFTFSSTMFTDHMPNNYEWAIQSLLEACTTNK